jgi:hypothetical protein
MKKSQDNFMGFLPVILMGVYRCRARFSVRIGVRVSDRVRVEVDG